MNTDITASTKPEYPVIDRNPPFTKVVGNFNTLDYLRFVTITGVSVTFGYLSGIKPGIRGPSMVTGGLIGLMGGFMYAYQNSAGRLMGFFPNDDEVCNLVWSKNVNELVSTHGYSQNQIIVWRYPTMSKLATLTGHTYRVLYLAISPDGQTIVTGAGDETLRFWNVFPSPKSQNTDSEIGASSLGRTTIR